MADQKKEDKPEAARCPKCGECMEKVEVLVINNLQNGAIQMSEGIDDAYIGWVCQNKKCRKEP